MSHFLLRRDVMHLPRFTAFELWCGALEYLYVPGTKSHNGVRFKVSLGYAREWLWRGWSRAQLRQILPQL